MSCDNNCEAIAGLHESAANLVEYEKLIDKWLNGNANEEVVIAGTPTPTLLNLAMSIKQLVGVWPDNITIKICADKKIYVPLKENGGIHTSNQGLYIDLADFLQAGGGLGIDNQGRWFVDFDQMPTTKFDAILEKFRKGLRLPKWLTGNTSFYVDKNHAAASDTLDDGRGLTPTKPFASIQACANYVCDNYNLSNYIATINVKSGEYSDLRLGEFTRNNGRIDIISDTPGGVVVSNNSTLVACNITGGAWALHDIKFKIVRNLSEVANNSASNCIAFSAEKNSTATLYAPCFELGYSNSLPSGVTKSVINICILLASGAQATINTGNQNMAWVMHNDPANNVKSRGLSIDNGTLILNSDSTANNAVISCTGNYDIFAQCVSSGLIQKQTRWPNQISFSGSSAGKRYQATSGGKIDTNSAGAEYFPGSIAGTVEASTYSWYK